MLIDLLFPIRFPTHIKEKVRKNTLPKDFQRIPQTPQLKRKWELQWTQLVPEVCNNCGHPRRKKMLFDR